jgi:hypothetical protein
MVSISPAGDELRESLRRFPALAHCTTIDWFLPWPEEALRAVAMAHLQPKAAAFSKLISDYAGSKKN